MTSVPRAVELAEDECWTLAAGQPIGRLAWTGPHGPTVIPVNFVIADGEVRIRTAAYSALAREADDSNVAFEIDDFSTDDRTGWSVLVRGRARLRFDGSHDAGDQPDVWPDVWPAGTHVLRVSVDVHEITGRRVALPRTNHGGEPR